MSDSTVFGKQPDRKPGTWLSVGEAAYLLPNKDRIHTFIQVGNAFLGCDRDRGEILNLMRLASRIEVSGPQAQALGHRIVIHGAFSYEDPVFVETEEF